MTVFNGSPKDYAASLGLAKAGRGRMSVAAVEAVRKARAEGWTFSKESTPSAAGKASGKPAKSAAIKIGTVKNSGGRSNESQSKINAKAVREWAKANGREVSARGRINATLISDYVNDVPESDRKMDEVSKSDSFGATPDPVNPAGVKYRGEIEGKTITTTGGDGAAVCMNSGGSIMYCSPVLHPGKPHRIITPGALDGLDVERI